MYILSSLKKLETFVYVMILLLPLVFLPFVSINFVLAKTVFARSLILLFFLFWGLLLLKRNKINIPSALKDVTIIKSLVFLLTVLLISNLFSIAPKLSFWGGYFRMQGLYTYIHYFLFFFLVLFTFKKDSQWKKANFCAFLIYIFLLFLSILQFLGLDLLFFQDFTNHGNRISASFANPNFFAAFIVLLIFPVLAFLNKKRSFYIVLIILLSFFVLILTGSKGGIIGFVVGSLVYAFMNMKFLKDRKYLYFLGIIFALIFFVILAAPKINLLYRFDFNQENLVSTNTRLQIWKDSLLMLEDRPVVGFGLETFPVVFHKYANLEKLNRDHLFGIIDKPHNTFIEILYSTGFVGLFVYIFIVLTVLNKSLKKLPSLSKKKKIDLIAVISGITAFCVSNLFSFSVTVHFVFLSFYLAYLIYLISDKNISLQVFKNNLYKKLSAFLLIFFVISSLVLNNVFYVLADVHAKRGFEHLKLGNTNAVVDNFYKANLYNPNQSYYNYLLASVFIEIEEIELAKIYLENGADFDSKEGDFYQFLSKKIY